MPVTVTDARGDHVSVVTTGDLWTAVWKTVLAFGLPSLGLIVATSIWVANIDSRLVQVELSTISMSGAAAANQQRIEPEIRGLTKRLDSLVIIIGIQSTTLADQSATLRDISRRLR